MNLTVEIRVWLTLYISYICLNVRTYVSKWGKSIRELFTYSCRLAVEMIIAESKRAKVRAEQCGPSGWYACMFVGWHIRISMYICMYVHVHAFKNISLWSLE